MQLLAGLEVAQKECRGPCGKEKPLTEFNVRSDSPDGRQSYCVECSRRETGKSMRRLRGLEGRSREADRNRFDRWCQSWLERHPERT